jgi:hypothetical protein
MCSPSVNILVFASVIVTNFIISVSFIRCLDNSRSWERTTVRPPAPGSWYATRSIMYSQLGLERLYGLQDLCGKYAEFDRNEHQFI